MERMIASTRLEAIGCVNVGGIRSRTKLNLDIPKLPGAACKDYERPQDFHSTARFVDPAKAREVCASCPVKQECLDWVMEREGRIGARESGVWGGLTEWEREEIREANPPDKRYCQAGLHEMTDENTYATGDQKQYRSCLKCRRTSQYAYEAKNRIDRRFDRHTTRYLKDAA